MSKRILIVEDEPNIVESLSFLLTREGFSVASEKDGAEALAKVRAYKPDLVILDVMLPNRSGFDILRELKTIGPLPRVLMLTAKGQSADRETALESGADLFMTKPFSNSELIEAVKSLLNRNGE